LCLLGATGCVTSRTGTTTFTVGNTTVQALVIQRGSAAPTMINVHDDENTSVRAGRQAVRELGGRLIELSHGGKRLVAFELAGETYRFDPNRIFSDEGIRATLRKQGRYTQAAGQEVKRFATNLLQHYALDGAPVIIALHNTDGQGLTIQSYLPGAQQGQASSKVHVSTQRSPGDFFYVTDPRFFDHLKSKDFNVTLQDEAQVPDDGSLSVYFARRGIPYVNVEADIRHLPEQVEMVRVARLMVDELGLIPKTARD
jgi:hypothetical protein